MTSRIIRADGTTELASIKSVAYHESVNADIDLRSGCVTSSYIEVTCFGAQTDSPTVGEALTYYQVVGEEETLVGIFYAEPSIPTKNSYSFVAYDAIYKLDADFSEWLSANQDNFPYTVYQLVSQACTIAGVTLGMSSWANSTMSVNAFYADGITCRNILQYAAEIACKFVRCNTSGEIVFDWYSVVSNQRIYPSSGMSGNEERFAYKQDGLNYANFDTSVLARVAVHPVGEDDVAYYYPTGVTGGNTLDITNNALLYGASSVVMLNIAQTVYNGITAVGQYRPISVNMFPNECPFRSGNIVSVTDAQGISFTTVIMQKTVTDSAVNLASDGREAYGDYASDTTKKLIQLAADIVRINKLKVDWAEIGTAIIDTLEANGINADWINAGAFKVEDGYGNTVFEADIDTHVAQIGGFGAFLGTLTHEFSDANGRKKFQIHSDEDNSMGNDYWSVMCYDSNNTLLSYWQLADYISISSLQQYSGIELIYFGNNASSSISLTNNGIYFGTGGYWQVHFNGNYLEFRNDTIRANWLDALGAVSKAGDTMTGELQFNLSGKSGNPRIRPVAQGTGTAEGLIVQGSTGLILGSGEGAVNAYNANLNNVQSAAGEHLWLISDQQILIYTGANTIENAVLALQIDALGQITNNVTIAKATPYLEIKATNREEGTAPSSNVSEGVRMYDGSGNVVGFVGSRYTIGKRSDVRLVAFGYGTGEQVTNELTLSVSASGVRTVQFTDAAPWLSALGLTPTPITLAVADPLPAGVGSVTITGAQKSGAIVSVTFSVNRNTTAMNSWTTIASGLPAPAYNVELSGIMPKGDPTLLADRPLYARVNTNGQLQIAYGTRTTSNVGYTVTITYVAASA